MKRIFSARTTVLSVFLATGCGNAVRPLARIGDVAQKNPVAAMGAIAFAEHSGISYRGMSSAQLDTLCVDLSSVDISVLQASFDAHAADVGVSQPEVAHWYQQYKLNDEDYVTQCLSGGFPKTFTSIRTGTSYTVANLIECRAVTSSQTAAEYVNYLRGGGAPVLIAAKIKTTGCSGASAPFGGRIQSAHGSFIDDYRAIPASYP